MEIRRVSVSSSFSFGALKLKDDKGNGEAKLYIGHKNADWFSFFNEFSSANKYYLDVEKTIEYLKHAYKNFTASVVCM